MVKLHFYPSELETFLKNTEACPAIKYLEKKLYGQSKVLQTLAKSNAQFKKDLYQIFGVNTALPEWSLKHPEWAAPMDVVHARLCQDLPQPCEPTSGHKVADEDATTENKKHKDPNCVTHAMIERIQDNARIFAAATQRDGEGVHKLMRLVAGPLVSDMRQDLTRARHKGPIRFTLFSAHDDTVTSVLGVLKSKDMRWPPYASNVLFELWKVPCENTHHGCGSTDNDNYFVRVFYNGAV
ncbi:Acid phosphatase-like protein 2, partial [Actinomortierella ambigua]